MQFNEKWTYKALFRETPELHHLLSCPFENVDITHLGHRAGCILLAVFAMTAFAACGNRSANEEDYPPPGHMRLLSVEAANSLYSSKNLVANGNFSIWYAGSPAPDSFFMPKDTKVSRLRRLESRGGSGAFSADQWWYAADTDKPYVELLHTIVPNIQPDRVYELSIHALSYYHTTASISLIALDENGQPAGAWENIITLTPGNPREQTHKQKIRTSHRGSLLIASHGNEKTKYIDKTRICWLEWSLVEAPAEPEDAILLPVKPT